MNANEFTFDQWARIIHIAKWMNLGVSYAARAYGLPAKEKGGGIWDRNPEDEVIPALDLGLK